MEKSTASASSSPISDVEKNTATAHVKEEQPEHEVVAPKWHPGYVKQFPVLGFLALLGVVLCAVGSVAVLVFSNHVSSTKWTYKLAPNVVLSGLNAISNILLAVAITKGVAIAWWRKAMRGATVAQLHKSWAFSDGTREILLSFWSLDVIAVAMLATKLAVVDSILYQRATSTYTMHDPPRMIPMVGAASMQFPTTGYVVSDDNIAGSTDCSCYMIGDTYTPVVNTWETSNGFFKGYHDYFRTCEGICFTSIDAIGFEIDCQESTEHKFLAGNAIPAYDASNGTATGNQSEWTNLPIFNSSFGMQYPDSQRNYSQLFLDLQYFQSDDPNMPTDQKCPGRVFTTSCSLRPALIRYPLKITNFTNVHINNGVNLGTFSENGMNVDSSSAGLVPEYQKSMKQAEGFEVLDYIYPAEPEQVNSMTALGGIVTALSQFLSSTATITYTGNSNWALRQQGTLSQTMMYGPPNMGSCDCSFRNDSLDSIVAQINQLTFLTATGLIDNSTFTGKQPPSAGTLATVKEIGDTITTPVRNLNDTILIADVIYYQTNFLYMWLGLASTLLCVLMVIPTFWRYGDLGRHVTLGPIEIAWAFRAPVLTDGRTAHQQSEGTVSNVIRDIGQRQVMYGFVDETRPAAGNVAAHHSVALAMEAPVKVRPASGVWSTPTSPRVG